MSFHAVPNHFRPSQIATVDHRELALAPAVRSSLELYLHVELDIVRLDDGPFDFVFVRDDGSIGRYTFPFRAHMPCGKRLAIAVDDEAYAHAHDLNAYLQDLRQRMPPAVADEIYLLTERGLDGLASPAADH